MRNGRGAEGALAPDANERSEDNYRDGGDLYVPAKD